GWRWPGAGEGMLPGRLVERKHRTGGEGDSEHLRFAGHSEAVPQGEGGPGIDLRARRHGGNGRRHLRIPRARGEGDSLGPDISTRRRGGGDIYRAGVRIEVPRLLREAETQVCKT